MAAVEVAAGYISLVPSAQGIQQAAEKELGPLEQTAKDVGTKASAGFGGNLKAGLGPAFKVLPPELQDLGSKFGDLGTTAGQTFRTNLEKGLTVGAGVGALIAGIGIQTSLAAAKAAEGERALQKVIENSGASYEAYKDKIDKAADRQAKFGHNAEDVDAALTTLTLRLHDPQKALDALGLAADIAALKHISLKDAALLTAQAQAGNSRVLKQFGIDLKDSAQLQDDATKATAAQSKAAEALMKATQHLNDTEALLADKRKLSTADAISLRHAEEDVAAARASGDAGKISDAEEHLADVRAKLLDKTQLTTAEQFKLRDAHDAVTQATAALADANDHVTQTQAAARDVISGTSDAVDKLKANVDGLANEQSQTLKGKIDGLTASFQNLEVEIGQKYGPTLAAGGSIMTGVLGVAANLAAVHDAKLIPSLSKTSIGFEGTAAEGLAAGAALLGAVVAGGLLGLKLHELVEEHFPGIDRALEQFGGTLYDDVINPISRLSGKDGPLAHLGGAIYDDIVTPLDKAWQSADKFIKRLTDVRNIPGIGAIATIAGIPGRAAGGDVQPGQAYVVGEVRPEVFVPREAGTIIPSVAGAGAGNGVSVTVQAHTGASPGEIGRVAAREVAWAIKH